MFLYNVILKCFQNHCHLFKGQKQTKAFFKVSRSLFLVLNWTTNSWRGIKNLLRSRHEKARESCQHGPENGKPTSTTQNREATTEEVPGSKTQPKTRKRVRRLQSSWIVILRKVYKTELNLNSISKTFQDTYHISIATLNFQCFRLDTSFLSVLPPKR